MCQQKIVCKKIAGNTGARMLFFVVENTVPRRETCRGAVYKPESGLVILPIKLNTIKLFLELWKFCIQGSSSARTSPGRACAQGRWAHAGSVVGYWSSVKTENQKPVCLEMRS